MPITPIPTDPPRIYAEGSRTATATHFNYTTTAEFGALPGDLWVRVASASSNTVRFEGFQWLVDYFIVSQGLFDPAGIGTMSETLTWPAPLSTPQRSIFSQLWVLSGGTTFKTSNVKRIRP